MSKQPGIKDVLAKPVKNADILVAFILDKSGSMELVQTATISGFNEYRDQQERDGDSLGTTTLASLTLFDTTVETRYEGVDIKRIPKLTNATYNPGGGTALYDAIGRTIRSIDGIRNLPPKVLVVIQTDGEENSSREFNRQQIFDLISRKRAQGWAFAFLGADQDAYAAGFRLGISHGSTLSYSSADTLGTFATASSSTLSYRTALTGADELFEDPGNAQQVVPPKKKTTPSKPTVS